MARLLLFLLDFVFFPQFFSTTTVIPGVYFLGNIFKLTRFFPAPLSHRRFKRGGGNPFFVVGFPVNISEQLQFRVASWSPRGGARRHKSLTIVVFCCSDHQRQQRQRRRARQLSRAPNAKTQQHLAPTTHVAATASGWGVSYVVCLCPSQLGGGEEAVSSSAELLYLGVGGFLLVRPPGKTTSLS